MQVIEVDMIGLQPLQSLLAGAPQGLRPAIDHTGLADIAHAGLAGDDDLVANRLQAFADKLFVASQTVKGGGVDMLDAEIDGAPQQIAGRLRRGRRAIGVAEAHATEPDAVDGLTQE